MSFRVSGVWASPGADAPALLVAAPTVPSVLGSPLPLASALQRSAANVSAPPIMLPTTPPSIRNLDLEIDDSDDPGEGAAAVTGCDDAGFALGSVTPASRSASAT